MPANGLNAKSLIYRGCPLYTLIATHYAPVAPLSVYTLAAEYDIEPLAMEASAYLHPLRVDEIDDASALRMGPSYLMRLVLLSTNRANALKSIVSMAKPVLHAPHDGSECNKEGQEKMASMWVSTVTEFTWEAKSGECACCWPFLISCRLTIHRFVCEFYS